jgi:hypothetical protein
MTYNHEALLKDLRLNHPETKFHIEDGELFVDEEINTYINVNEAADSVIEDDLIAEEFQYREWVQNVEWRLYRSFQSIYGHPA